MSARRPGLLVAALAACVGLLSACSQDAPLLDGTATAPLHAHVATARAALADNDTAEARQALAQFRTEVRRLSGTGDINAGDAQVLVAYSEQIDAEIPATVPDRTTGSTAPKIVAPRDLDDVTAPVPTAPDPEPARTAPPAQSSPAPQNNDDDPSGVGEPEAPEPNDPDPGEENPGTEDPGPEEPGDEESAPEPSEPDDPQAEEPPRDDTDTAPEGASE